MSDESGRVPPTGYLICTEARTGSTFLCRAPASTGVLGLPREHFAWPDNRVAVGRNPLGGTEALIAGASTPNGVYGLKIFSYQFDMMESSGWIGRLENPHFIHLERRDLLGQAISHLRAMQTGQYVADEAAVAEARFDHRALAATLADLARNHARWRHYFARNGITPLCLAYEDVIADPQAAAEAIADHIGVAGPVAVDLSQIELEVQRDALSDEWRARFIAMMADRSRLDDWWLGKVRRIVRRVRARRERRR